MTTTHHPLSLAARVEAFTGQPVAANLVALIAALDGLRPMISLEEVVEGREFAQDRAEARTVPGTNFPRAGRHSVRSTLLLTRVA